MHCPATCAYTGRLCDVLLADLLTKSFLISLSVAAALIPFRCVDVHAAWCPIHKCLHTCAGRPGIAPSSDVLVSMPPSVLFANALDTCAGRPGIAPSAAANGTAGRKAGARRGKRTRYDTSSSSEDEEEEESEPENETDEVRAYHMEFMMELEQCGSCNRAACPVVRSTCISEQASKWLIA